MLPFLVPKILCTNAYNTCFSLNLIDSNMQTPHSITITAIIHKRPRNRRRPFVGRRSLEPLERRQCRP